MKNTFSRKQDNNGLKEEASSTKKSDHRKPRPGCTADGGVAHVTSEFPVAGGSGRTAQQREKRAAATAARAPATEHEGADDGRSGDQDHAADRVGAHRALQMLVRRHVSGYSLSPWLGVQILVLK